MSRNERLLVPNPFESIPAMRPIYPSLLLLFVAVNFTQGALTETRAERPNILLIIADDLGFSDIGSYGGEIETPNLDRLAQQGTRFTQFYNNAVCVTTRASVYSGAYPQQGQGFEGMLRPNMVTLGEAMQGAGYETSLIGKWHLGSTAPQRPIDRGFEDYYGVLSGACNFFDPSIPDPLFYGNNGANRPFAHNDTLVTEFPDDFYTTDAFSAHAVERIQHAQRSGTPFFINLCYTAPHFPLQAPAEDIARYRGKYHEGYRALRERRYARQIELGIVNPAVTPLEDADDKTSDFRYDYAVPRWEDLDDATRAREERRMEVYAAMVDRMDQGIGRVLTALEESGQMDNTLVIFISDNGGCASLPTVDKMAEYDAFNRDVPIGEKDGYEFVGPSWGWAQNTPFRRYKGWNYEGGFCTPMIVRWPGRVAPGELTHEVGHVVDFMPTFLELAGISYAEAAGSREVLPLVGRSLLPVFEGGPVRPRGEMLCWALMGNRAVRDGDWKMVWGASDQRWELYDLVADRSESTDLASTQPARVRRMATAWNLWAIQTEVQDL